MVFGAPEFKTNDSPSLKWKARDLSDSTGGVITSNWNPLRGLVVSLKDETIASKRVTVIIEPPSPGCGICGLMFCVPMFPFFWPLVCPSIIFRSHAHAYIFEVNSTGQIDLIHRRKPFCRNEVRKTYHDVTHFCAVIVQFREVAETHVHDETISQSHFLLTYRDGEIKLPTGENFSKTSATKLNLITDTVNNLISTILENRIDLNDDIQASHVIPDSSIKIATGYYVTSSLVPLEDTTVASSDTDVSISSSHDESAEALAYTNKIDRD